MKHNSPADFLASGKAGGIGQILCKFVEEPALQVYPVCPQGTVMDIVFLVDRTSMSPHEFTWIKDFLYVLVDRFYVGEMNQVQFGLVQDSDQPHTEIHLNTYKMKKDIQWHIWNLEMTSDNKKTTAELKGSRINQWVPQFLVVIDGQQYTGSMKENLPEMKKNGITVYAIGRKDSVEEERRKMVSKPENMYFVSNFSNLHDITGDIIQSLCATAEERRNVSIHLTPGLYNTENQITLQRRRSLTIQCHYGEECRDHVKYWCRMRTQSSCTTIVSTDTAEKRGNVSITDDPAHHVFHVTMRDLQTMDTDVYWCGVETNNTELYMAPLNLTVTAGFPGLSVENNMLTGETGGNVSIQSFYSEGNREQEKRWCRRGSSCVTAEGSKTSQDRVHLDVNDRRRVFTVTVTGLESNDMGWYWINAGDQHFPVHITVLPGGRSSGPPKMLTVSLHMTVQQTVSHRVQIIQVLLHGAVILVFLICTVVAMTLHIF
ncbi:uncharacterized protein LOC111860735 [Arapaima gigas]